MLRFQLWKIFLVFSVLSLGVIYSLPNIFPPDPAVQITFNSSGGSFNDRVVENIKSNAEKKKIIASVERPIVSIAPAPGQSINLNSAPKITMAAPIP